MMLIILINLVIVLVLLLGFVLFLNRREKQRKNSEIERLLVELEENETIRQKQIVNILTTQMGVSEQMVLEKVENFVTVEKRFIHKFLEIAMDQQPVANFYQYCCECLDEYMQLIADNLPEPTAAHKEVVEKQAIPELQNNTSSEQSSKLEDSQVVTPDQDPEEISKTNRESAPEVDDSFEKSAENQVEDDELSEEPDWGDAFAEAGVKMEDNNKEEEN